MKKTIILSIFLAASSVVFPAYRTADISNIREKDGMIYYSGDTTPFTGKVRDEKDRTYYKDGRPNGKWITFFPNGNIKSIENWEDGKLNGKYVIYQENGIKVMETNYLMGQDNGKYFLYHENGVLQIEGQFKKGIPSGTWKYYHPTGKLKGKAVHSD